MQLKKATGEGRGRMSVCVKYELGELSGCWGGDSSKDMKFKFIVGRKNYSHGLIKQLYT